MHAKGLLDLSRKVIDGVDVSQDNRDQVCWYGDMEFLGHFMHLLSLKKVEVDLKIHPPITHSDPTELSLLSHTLVSKSFTPLV